MHGPKPFDPPSDFADHVYKPNEELKRLYKVGDKVIARWRKQLGITVQTGGHNKVRGGSASLPCPDDFKEKAQLPTANLMAQYKVGEKVIRRWRQECGVKVARAFAAGQQHKPITPTVGGSRASVAAQFLRSTYRPVYHRIIENKHLAGTYVVGHNILSEEEMMALAVEKGFDPHVIY